MSTSCVLFTLLSRLILPDKIKPRVVVPKINVMTIKTIAIIIQTFTEQYVLPFLTTQFCTGKHGFSGQLCINSNPISSCLISWTNKVTFDEQYNVISMCIYAICNEWECFKFFKKIIKSKKDINNISASQNNPCICFFHI